MLNIINDDSSVVKHFWKGSHDLEELNLWFEISKMKVYLLMVLTQVYIQLHP